jgi:hypothetical protein
VFNEDGQPETVKYHLLPSFLLAGYQQQHKVIQALERRLKHLEARLPCPAPRSSAVETRGNNTVRGNTTDVIGALTPIGGK